MYDTDKITDKMVAQDPFNIGAGDLKLMRACESSLWEVATVSMCAPEKVYKGTQFIKRVGALEEMNISPDLLELDYEDVSKYQQECWNWRLYIILVEIKLNPLWTKFFFSSFFGT